MGGGGRKILHDDDFTHRDLQTDLFIVRRLGSAAKVEILIISQTIQTRMCSSTLIEIQLDSSRSYLVYIHPPMIVDRPREPPFCFPSVNVFLRETKTITLILVEIFCDNYQPTSMTVNYSSQRETETFFFLDTFLGFSVREEREREGEKEKNALERRV